MTPEDTTPETPEEETLAPSDVEEDATEEEKPVNWRSVISFNPVDFATLDALQAEIKRERPEELQAFKRYRNWAYKNRLRGKLIWTSEPTGTRSGTFNEGRNKAKREKRLKKAG